jgi:hypothetical protein
VSIVNEAPVSKLPLIANFRSKLFADFLEMLKLQRTIKIAEI